MASCAGLNLALALLLLLLATVQAVEQGKVCTVDANCTSIAHTKCMSDPSDSKMRCLCEDKKPPKDGKCEVVGKALHKDCEDESECPDNAECMFPNGVTNVTEPAVKKQCVCKKGFREFARGTQCVVVGTECKADKDCSSHENTTCTQDRVDSKKRCLCGNGVAFGVRPECPKGALMQPCSSDELCPINAECTSMADGQAAICHCVANFKSSENIFCEPNSVGRVATLSAAMLLFYASVVVIM